MVFCISCIEYIPTIDIRLDLLTHKARGEGLFTFFAFLSALGQKNDSTFELKDHALSSLLPRLSEGGDSISEEKHHAIISFATVLRQNNF